VNPQTRVAKRLYPSGLTTSEFAAALGKSVSTVIRWRRVGILSPRYQVQTGKTAVWLYSPDDLVEGKKLVATLRPGRKVKT